MELSPCAPSPLRWPSGQRSAGHRKRLLRPHVSLLQRLPTGALRQARSSQPGRSPVSRSPSPDGPEEREFRPARHRAQSEGKASCAAGQRHFGAPCGPPEESGQPRAHSAQRAPSEAALPERSDRKPKPKWSRTAPRPSSRHGKEQSEPAWSAATKRITSEALLMKWMNLEHMKQGSQSERENLDSRRMVLTNLFTRQQWRHRHGEETYGQGWGTRGRG